MNLKSKLLLHQETNKKVDENHIKSENRNETFANHKKDNK